MAMRGTTSLTTSRARAYRWGEDGLGGISDDKQRLCFALALWNERDPILKERLFGLTNSEGNHGGGRQGVLLLHRQHLDVAKEITRRLASAFLPDADGRRPVYLHGRLVMEQVGGEQIKA
jgi:hypothetical protein